MKIVHLAASPFFGGPERQMLGLAQALPGDCRSVFVAFPDRGSSQVLLNEVRGHGFEALALGHDTPHFRAAARELADHLLRLGADVLSCNGYKPDIIGWLAARRAGIPVISVSHGWTGATLKVRLNETVDRLVLRRMDAVVCVSEAQAVKVRRAGVSPDRVVVIRNAVRTEPFDHPDPSYQEVLRQLFPLPCRRVVGAAGRLSPEKGFEQLVRAAKVVTRADPRVGFVLFGDGPLRHSLARQIRYSGLQDHFILAGFRTDVERFLPHLDLAVLPSFTEGLPVVVLEAFAAGLPVVATAVGGTPEVVEEGVNGYLVPPGRPADLARRILDVLKDEDQRRAMGERGRQRVRDHFTFAGMGARYHQLFQGLTKSSGREYRNSSVGAGVLADKESVCES